MEFDDTYAFVCMFDPWKYDVDVSVASRRSDQTLTELYLDRFKLLKNKVLTIITHM